MTFNNSSRKILFKMRKWFVDKSFGNRYKQMIIDEPKVKNIVLILLELGTLNNQSYIMKINLWSSVTIKMGLKVVSDLFDLYFFFNFITLSYLYHELINDKISQPFYIDTGYIFQLIDYTQQYATLSLHWFTN